MAKKIAVIVGGESLLGREIKELAGDLFRLQILGGEEEEVAVIEQQQDELTVLARLEKASLKDADVVVLTASSAGICQQAIDWAPKKVPVVDAKGLLDEKPGARLFRPKGPTARLTVIPTSAAQVLANLLTTLAAVHPIERSVVTIFEPASEWGQAGVAELQGQAVSLLTFKPIVKKIFDAQLAFNKLAAFGEDSKFSLAEKEARIERHLASLLAAANGPPMPSLRLIQAPVFHGYSMSVWVEFEKSPNKIKIEAALTKAGTDVRDDSLEPPNNVGIAQQSGYAVGAVRVDSNNPKAIWLWTVADNVRIAADSAIAAMTAVVGA